MSVRQRSRSRSPLRTKGGIMGGERRAPPPRDRNGTSRGGGLNSQSDKMVYLSNMPYEMTWMELKAIVREKAGEVNFVETLDNREGKSKGCAVIEFKTRESAEKCVEVMHRTDLRGRLIVVKEIRDPIAFFRKVKEDTGLDFLGSRDRQSANGAGRGRVQARSLSSAADNETFGLSPAFLDQLNIKLPLVNRIFITNISYNCGVGRLFDCCSLAGKVIWLDLQLDQDGKSKGMAVCQYSHPIEAVQAVSMLHDQRLFDRTLAVKMDRFDKDPATQRRDGELPVGLRGIGMGLGANGAPLADVASVISSMTAPAHLNGNSMAVTAAPIANPFGASANPFASSVQPIQQQQAMPQQQQQNAYSNSDLANTFHNPQPSYVAPSQQQQLQQSYYSAAPTPVQPVPAPQPIAQNNSSQHFFNKPQTNSGGISAGRMDAVGYGSSAAQHGGIKYETKYEPQSMGHGGFPSAGTNSGPIGGVGNSSVYGGSSLGAYDSQSASRVVLIKNLPLDYTWQIVSDRVQQFGDLESVEMISSGVAKVRFVQLADAERAKATLQGTTVEGRTIGIEYL